MNAALVQISMMVRSKDYLSACRAALEGDHGLVDPDRLTLERGRDSYADPEFCASLGFPVEHLRQQDVKLLLHRYTMPAEGLTTA